MDLLRLVLCAVIGYLFGNIQTGFLIGRATKHVDLRDHGSGSSGATNALRVLGSRAALLTFVGDLLKGILAVVVGKAIAGMHGGMIAALFVVVGHIWPVFFGLHGGKGVVTSIGALAVLFPYHVLALLVVGIAVAAATKIISLASLLGAITFLLTGSITAVMQRDWFMLAFVLLMSGLVFFAHRQNIQRLRTGKEAKVSGDMFKRK